jgi:hypothetical protein
MEWGDEETAQECSCRGPRQLRWPGAKRGQEARQQTKRPQGRPGQKPREKDLPPGATPDAHARGAARRPTRGSCSDSLAFWIRRYWSRLWRNPLFRRRAPLDFPAMGPIEDRGQAVQLSFLCACGSRIALKNLGCCRSGYERRHHSLRSFGGLRERVLVRDRFRCRGCGKRSALIVHHRDQRNRTNLLVTPLYPLSCTHPSLFRVEILVPRSTGEIVARSASECADANSNSPSKMWRRRTIAARFQTMAHPVKVSVTTRSRYRSVVAGQIADGVGLCRRRRLLRA